MSTCIEEEKEEKVDPWVYSKENFSSSVLNLHYTANTIQFENNKNKQCSSNNSHTLFWKNDCSPMNQASHIFVSRSIIKTSFVVEFFILFVQIFSHSTSTALHHSNLLIPRSSVNSVYNLPLTKHWRSFHIRPYYRLPFVSALCGDTITIIHILILTKVGLSFASIFFVTLDLSPFFFNIRASKQFSLYLKWFKR